jgi:hypothetical protein
MLEAWGERRPVARGEVLIAEGKQEDVFYGVLSGRVAVAEGFGTPDQRVPDHVLGAHRRSPGPVWRARPDVTAGVGTAPPSRTSPHRLGPTAPARRSRPVAGR